MANRRDYFFRQKVTEAELDAGFAGLEDADRAIMLDNVFAGVVSGAQVSEHAGVADLTVDVAGPGRAWSKAGERIAFSALQNVNLAVDSNGVTTTVATPGNSKIVSLFLQFDRALSDPRTDGNSLTVYFVRDESFKFKVVQSAEALAPTPPPLISDGILLADITRTNGQTQILNADISTSRREDAFVLTGSPASVRAGTVKAAMQSILTQMNALGGAAVAYAGGGAWANGDTNPATTVELQLDKIIADLADQVGAAADGASRIGAAAVGDLGAGTIRSQLNALDTAWGKLARANAWTAVQTFSEKIVANGAVGDDQPAIESTAAITTRKLFTVGPVDSNGARQRMYWSAVNGFEITYNAKWNPGTLQWNTDAGTLATIERISNVLRIVQMQTGAAAWADSAWTRTIKEEHLLDGIGTTSWSPSAVWYDKLGKRRFGVDHNGFPIGGHLSVLRNEWHHSALPQGWAEAVLAGAATGAFVAPDATNGFRTRRLRVTAAGDAIENNGEALIPAGHPNHVVVIEFEASLSALDNVKTFIGLATTVSFSNPFSDASHSIGFLFDNGSDNWRGYNRTTGAGNQNNTIGSVGAVADTMAQFRIEIHGANTAQAAKKILFFVNSTLIATHTTHISENAYALVIYSEGLGGLAGNADVKVGPITVVWNRQLTPPLL